MTPDEREVEALVTRRRHRLHGVAVLVGDPHQSFELPGEHRYRVTVRPAWRSVAPKRSKAEIVSEAVFEALKWPLTGLCVLSLLAVAVIQVFHHAH